MTISHNNKCHEDNKSAPDYISIYTMTNSVDNNKMPTTVPEEIHITFTTEFVICTNCNGTYSRHSKVYS